MADDRPPAYVPGFESDIFISYAWADDEKELRPLGRVSTFVDLLTKRLTRYLGGVGKCSIWHDRRQITGAFQITPSIEKALNGTAFMLAFLSRGYYESLWCPGERDFFLQVAPPSATGATRLLMVELDPLEAGWVPKELKDHFRYKFWKQEPIDKYPRSLDAYNPAMIEEYLRNIDDLARDLSKALDDMRGRAGAQSSPKIEAIVNEPKADEPQAHRTIVYLAETTDDLEPTWRKVKCYLEQNNFTVLPPRQDLPRDLVGFRSAVKDQLGDADLFVQLLSLVPGRKIDEVQSYVKYQLQLAREAELPILQWRDPRLSESQRSEVEDPIHRELLDGEHVQAVPILEFQQNVVATLERLRADEERKKELAKKEAALLLGKSNEHFIFVLADPKDGSMAVDIWKFFDERGFPCAVPITIEAVGEDLKPEDIRRDFEENVQRAAGTVIVYGTTPPLWYRSQLTRVSQVPGAHCKIGLAVVPPPKRVLYKLSGMHEIPCASGIEEQAFRPFLEAVTNGAPSAIVNK